MYDILHYKHLPMEWLLDWCIYSKLNHVNHFHDQCWKRISPIVITDAWTHYYEILLLLCYIPSISVAVTNTLLSTWNPVLSYREWWLPGNVFRLYRCTLVYDSEKPITFHQQTRHQWWYHPHRLPKLQWQTSVYSMSIFLFRLNGW